MLVEEGEEILVTVFNADQKGHLFRLPALREPGRWRLLLDTAHGGRRRIRGHALRVAPHDLVLLVFERARS